MKKIVLALLASFLLAANFAVAQAAQIPIYDYEASWLYNDIRDLMANSNYANCYLKNFKRTPYADNDWLKAWTCKLKLKSSRDFEGNMIFFVNEDSKVQLMQIAFDEESFNQDTEQISLMLMMSILSSFEALGFDEEELLEIYQELDRNFSAHSWDFWHEDKYFNLSGEMEDDFLIYTISAHDGSFEDISFKEY